VRRLACALKAAASRRTPKTGETTQNLPFLADLVIAWEMLPEVRETIRRLADGLESSREPFLGEALTVGGLPPGIASAWIFVLRPGILTPAHRHPNSIQHMAVLSGAGVLLSGGNPEPLRRFDPAGKVIHVIGRDVPHAFEVHGEPLVVLSFHTVSPQELLEVEVVSGRERTYVERG
jgi:quercetin dioxygenase-like cupin family protein